MLSWLDFPASRSQFDLLRLKHQVGRDQEVDIPTQLSNGIRLLQAQSHMCVARCGWQPHHRPNLINLFIEYRGFDSELHFCHTGEVD